MQDGYQGIFKWIRLIRRDILEESGGLKEGLKQDQMGIGEGALPTAIQSVRAIVRFT